MNTRYTKSDEIKEKLMKKYCIAILCSFMLFLTPVRAQTKKDLIYITSKDLPYVYLMEKTNKDHLNVFILPANLYLNTQLKKADITSARQMISQNLHLDSSKYVVIDMDAIDQDFHVKKKNYDLSTMDGITAYFMDAKKAISISDILNYQRYIDTNLSFSDDYEFYKMFSHKVTIDYIYLPYMQIDDMCIPLTLNI